MMWCNSRKGNANQDFGRGLAPWKMGAIRRHQCQSKSFKHLSDAVKYYFYTKPCSCCNNPLYFIGRTDGARSQITEEKIDNVELLVDELHQSFAVDITTILEALKDTISDITASDGWGRFQTDGLSNYRIKTLDRARLILKRFDGEGKLAHLEANADNIDDNLVSGFMLGYLASENWWIINHEDRAMLAGRSRSPLVCASAAVADRR